MTFSQHQIDVTFSIASGNFQGGGNNYGGASSAGSNAIASGNNPTFSGLRVSARIENAGLEVGQNASISIWGLPLALMNQVTVIGGVFGAIGKNTVTLTAGDAVNGKQLTFIGAIMSAYVDAQSQPQVCLRVEASATAQLNAKNSPPTSVKGATDISSIGPQLAQQAGLAWEGNGVSVKLRNPYFPNSIGNQIREAARTCGLMHSVDCGTLAMWDPNKGRTSLGTVVMSPQTGMVGYPAFNQASIVIRSIFNPKIKNGTILNVQSSLTPACGNWNVYSVTHEIESQMPKGKWFSTIEANLLKSGGGTSDGSN